MTSHLERVFFAAWEAFGDPTSMPSMPVAEYRFLPPRRWRFDAAFLLERVAVEIEGGTWSRGRHNRGSGFIADAEKYNTAAVLGWLVLRIPGPMLDDPAAAVRMVRRVLLRRRRERWPGLRLELRYRAMARRRCQDVSAYCNRG